MAAEPANSAETTDARTSSSNTTIQDAPPPEMIRQPESRQVTLDGLEAELKGIYAGLHMVESKTIETLSTLPAIVTDEQWKALIALHRVIIHEQYDFFLASQHPIASPSLRYRPTKYYMPARLWRHGIHSFLEVMRHRLPGPREAMYSFAYMSYTMMGLLEEMVPQLRKTWIECKGDLARYCMAIEDDDLELRQQWKKTSVEQYSQAIDHDPLVGYNYHHLAILNQAAVPQFFYFIKALVVKTAFFTARSSIFTLTDSILKKEHTDPFLAAAAHLVLASQSPGIRREKGHDTSKYDHHQSCCRALKELLLPDGGATAAATGLDSKEEWQVVPSEDEDRLLASLEAHILLSIQFEEATSLPSLTVSDGPTSESTSASSDEADQPAQANKNKENTPPVNFREYTLRPSHELGVLLCMLLLGIPQSDTTQSTAMAAWAPDYVKSADRADLAAKVANGIDVYEDADLAALLAAVTITYILKRADTTDVQFWEFVHVILVFMRAMMTRPDMHERFGWAFPAHLLAPFLNMALRDAESRGRGWNSLSQPEFPTMDSPIDRAEKSLQQTTFTTPLPEDKALRGLFFARQSGYRTGPQINSTDLRSSVPVEATEATTAGSQEQAEPSKEHKEALVEEEEENSEEARLQHVEDEKAESRDPNLFPCRWFVDSKYDFEEEMIRNGSVQDEETCLYRNIRVLWMASQLTQRCDGKPGFFSLETDGDSRTHIVVPDVPSLPQTYLHAKMPDVVEREGGGRVVFVNPLLIGHAARAAGDAAAALSDPISAAKLIAAKNRSSREGEAEAENTRPRSGEEVRMRENGSEVDQDEVDAQHRKASDASAATMMGTLAPNVVTGK